MHLDSGNTSHWSVPSRLFLTEGLEASMCCLLSPIGDDVWAMVFKNKETLKGKRHGSCMCKRYSFGDGIWGSCYR
jgi:hypothetical protein